MHFIRLAIGGQLAAAYAECLISKKKQQKRLSERLSVAVARGAVAFWWELPVLVAGNSGRWALVSKKPVQLGVRGVPARPLLIFFTSLIRSLRVCMPPALNSTPSTLFALQHFSPRRLRERNDTFAVIFR